VSEQRGDPQGRYRRERRATALIRRQVDEGRRIGVQNCVYQGPAVVLDTVAGTRGPDDPRPVRRAALFLSFSSTKGVGATVIHMLADRGPIEYEAPVAEYWPAFAGQGKSKVTVAQALSHQAGLHAMPEPFGPAHITDWDAGIRRLDEGIPAYPVSEFNGKQARKFIDRV